MMDDTTLLQFGCAVTFAALGGAYIFLEATFTRDSEKETTPDHEPIGTKLPVPVEATTNPNRKR